MEKTHLFRSAVLGIFVELFRTSFYDSGRHGGCEIRIAPEASPFRGDAYFEGLGAQTKHFWKNLIFLNMYFKHIFLNMLFFGTYFP